MSAYEHNFYLARSPNEDFSGLRLAATEKDKNLFTFFKQSELYSSTIRQAIKATGIEDPYCLLMAEFYETATVASDKLSQLQDLMSRPDIPVSKIYRAFSQAAKEKGITENLQTELASAVKAISWQNSCWLVDADGVLQRFEENRLSPWVNKNIAGFYGTNSVENSYAQSLRLNAMVWQYQLHWNKDLPQIDPTVRHTVLGKTNDSGSFEPVVTILSEQHPLRNKNKIDLIN